MRGRNCAALVWVLCIVAADPTSADSSIGRPTGADPVDLFTGLYVRASIDIMLDGNPPLVLKRSYRNKDDQSRAFGVGTSHAYDLYLVGDSSRFSWAALILEDGGRVNYVRTTAGTQADDAEFVHTATPTVFLGSHLRPLPPRHGWRIDLQTGGAYLFAPYSVPGKKSVDVRVTDYWDPKGHRIKFVRNVTGDLIRVDGGWFRKIYFTYDHAHRIVRAETGWGLSMAAVDYTYDPQGRLIRVRGDYITVFTIGAELLRAYTERRIPSLRQMLIEWTSEYSYDDKNQMETIAEPGVRLTNHYDSDGRVVGQDVDGWGSWTLWYTEDPPGKVVQTDLIDPDGLHRRLVFNHDGYTLSDTYAPGRPEEQRTDYERGAGNIATRISVTCGMQQTSEAVRAGESDEKVRERLLDRCGPLGPRPPRSFS